MSIEGLWAFVSNQYDDPNLFAAGGVVTMETGRIFGGDSAMVYLGSYEVDGNTVVGDVESFTYNPAYAEGLNVFGVTGEERVPIRFEGLRDGDGIKAEIWMKSNPDLRLTVVMTKVAELP